MKLISLISLVLVGSTVCAQSMKLKMANKLYDEFAYTRAINLYDELIREDKDVEQAKKMIASAYMKINNYRKAEEYYSQLLENNEYKPEAEEVLNYAMALKSNKKYNESELWYEKYGKMRLGDSRVEEHLEAGDYVSRLEATKDAYEINSVDFNSNVSDFGPSFYGDKLLFTSSRKKNLAVKRWHNWNGQPYTDIYVYDPEADSASNVQLLNVSGNGVNTRFHEGPASMDTSNIIIYFTRNNYQKKLRRSEDGEVKLQIYSAEWVENEWINERPFPFNDPKYSLGHPALAKNGKTLYFTSDKEGGLGGTDIWISEMNSAGEWKEPVNAGLEINTEGDEMFPFVGENGELFFASNGHVGLGGLDIFKAEQPGGKFQPPVNMGAPINSPMDDFGLIAKIGEDGNQEGYFASNREGGKGSDDIYSWKLLIRPLMLKGTLKDKENGNPLDSAELVLTDSKGKTIQVKTNHKGRFEFSLERGGSYQIKASKNNYFGAERSISSDVPDLQTEVLAEMTLEKDPGLSLFCLVKDAKTDLPLEGAKFYLLDNMTGSEVANITLSADGAYRTPLKEHKIGDRLSYNIKIEKENYLSKTVTFNHKIDKEGQIAVHKTLDLSLEPIEVGTDIGKLIDLNPIYYDYNKSAIRKDAAIELDKVVKVMNENPTLEVELGSHTDSRGSDSYNLKLSDKRAKSAANYVKELITSPERINGKGYGEQYISNRCTNGVECTDEEHAENRRTEFKIVKM